MPTLSTSAPELLRGAAHLLRTPLAVILGLTATLRDHDGRFSAEQRVLYLNEVHQAADEMRVALDGLSLLARLAEGSLTFTPTRAAVATVVRDGAATLAETWGSAVAERAGATGEVAVDRVRVGQALEAVARAFAPGPGVTLAATEGGGWSLILGPLEPRAAAEDIRAALAPLPDTTAVIARPAGWALLVARGLLEAQGGRLQADLDAPAGASVRLLVAPAPF